MDVQSLKDVLAAALQFELCGRLLPESVRAMAAEQALLEELYVLSGRHDVAHLVGDALRRSGLLQEGSPLSDNFRTCQIGAVTRYTQQCYEQARIEAVLAKVGVEYLPLKGAVLRDYYPDPSMRTSCDLDILVREEEADRAIDALEADLQYTCPERRSKLSEHDYKLIAPGGVHLELHYELIEPDRMTQANAYLRRVWTDSRPVDGKPCCRAMPNEMFFFYHIVHMAKHFLMGGCGVRTFLDLWLLCENMPLDRETLKAELEEAGLLRFAEQSVELARVWLENAPRTPLLEQMENFVLTGGTYGSLRNLQTVTAIHGLTKRRAIWNLLFMSPKRLTYIFPELEGHPLRYPYYQVKRWLRVFQKEKRRHIAAMIRSRNAISPEKEHRVKSLLEELDLESGKTNSSPA